MARVVINRPATLPPVAAPAPVPPAPAPARPTWSFFGIPLPGPNMGAAPAPAQPVTPTGATPISAYGINDTGRTTPFNPNPSFANNTTLGAARAPAYPAGSGSASGSSSASGALGILSPLLALFGLQQGNQYEAALRERPADVQRLVSTSRLPPEQRSQNAGGFLGGLFDNRG